MMSKERFGFSRNLGRRAAETVRRSLTITVAATVACVVLGGANVLAQDTSELVIQRAGAAHGKHLGSAEIRDSVAFGKLTLLNMDGPQGTFDVTLLRKGKSQVLRIVKMQGGEVRQGSDGIRKFDTAIGFAKPAYGRALYFVESLTDRSIERLFDYKSTGLTINDLERADRMDVVQTVDAAGRMTRYYIDRDTATIQKLEAITGAGTSAIGGQPMRTTDTFVFRDYRNVDGVLTPFRIERYINGLKVEEMQITSVQYNASVSDGAFK